MALSAPHACPTPGCRALVRGATRCPTHARVRDQERGTAHARGYDGRWRQYRLTYLLSNPLCCLCNAAGRVTPATVVDHIVAHKGNEQLFWDPTNHRAVCRPHHDARTDEGDFAQ
jgi:5-methylcytosine-specific restriction protein A